MKISVTVIAHNEELWIERCLSSLMNQTRPPDEIILVAHNCTDNTVTLAKKFLSVTIAELSEEVGPSYARTKAIESCTGDVVCCTDGDCWVDKHWVKNISDQLLKRKDISVVGGYTKIQNNLFWKFSCWWQFVINRKLLNKKGHRFAWGSNFAFRKRDYDVVGGLSPLFSLRKELNLNYDPDDLYLSLTLQKKGTIFFALNAVVYTFMPPEKASIRAQKIIVSKQKEDNKKLFTYFTI